LRFRRLLTLVDLELAQLADVRAVFLAPPDRRAIVVIPQSTDRCSRRVSPRSCTMITASL
jgi:hypothetical protein